MVQGIQARPDSRFPTSAPVPFLSNEIWKRMTVRLEGWVCG
jgi:hypothetical protein